MYKNEEVVMALRVFLLSLTDVNRTFSGLCCPSVFSTYRGRPTRVLGRPRHDMCGPSEAGVGPAAKSPTPSQTPTIQFEGDVMRKIFSHAPGLFFNSKLPSGGLKVSYSVSP